MLVLSVCIVHVLHMFSIFFALLQCAFGDTFTTLCYFQHLIETESTQCKHIHDSIIFVVFSLENVVVVVVKIAIYFYYSIDE